MRGWACRCGFKNEPSHRKCRGCSKKRPPRRVPVHARTLRDDTYQDYCRINEQIHHISDESCALCGKPKPERGRHHRDHGHDKNENSYGKPRGLLCFRCNRLLSRELTDEWLGAAMAFKDRVGAFYA